jgi:hypothetical protein
MRANGDYSVTVDRSGMSLYHVHYSTTNAYILDCYEYDHVPSASSISRG